MSRSLNLPDTYAGGNFGLPLKVAKLVRLADGTHSHPEKQSVIGKLWSMGWFLDKAGIIWPKDDVPQYVQAHDAKYRELVGGGEVAA